MFYYFLRFSVSFLVKLLLSCKVTGKENMPLQGACIIVANHVNLLDSPILGVSLGRRVYFMAKEEVFQSRLLGWLAEQSGGFPVGKGKLDRRAGRKASEILNGGGALIVLPEGRRSQDGKLGHAYPGVALLATKSHVPIVPVGITGTGRLVGKLWFFKRPKITVTIGKPFKLPKSESRLSKEEVARLTHKIMTRIADLLPPEYRGRYTP
jgi:1-acyl-sn-glycerol-3-phosphate acyltransferase